MNLNRPDLETAWREHQPALLRFFKKRARHHQDAEDLAHQTFLQAVKYQHRLHDSEKLLPWLIAIARNVWNNHTRHHHTQKRGAQLVPMDQAHEAAETRHPETALADQQSDEKMRGCVQQLPKQMLHVIAFFYYQDQTFEEIARTMKIRVNTVKSTAHAARQKLRTCMEQADGQPLERPR